jgi:hypothetical protein
LSLLDFWKRDRRAPSHWQRGSELVQAPLGESLRDIPYLKNEDGVKIRRVRSGHRDGIDENDYEYSETLPDGQMRSFRFLAEQVFTHEESARNKATVYLGLSLTDANGCKI